jgi:hypothetical protein
MCLFGMGVASPDAYFWKKVMKIVKSQIYFYKLGDVWRMKVMVHRR